MVSREQPIIFPTDRNLLCPDRQSFYQQEHTDLGPKRVIATHGPRARTDEPIGGRDPPKDVDQECYGVVGDVLSKGSACIGDGDAPAAAILEVNVVEASAGAHEELEVREEFESFCSKR